MPRRQTKYLPIPSEKKTIISHFFATISCAVCGVQTQQGLCEGCKEQPQTTIVMLADKVQHWEHKYEEINLVSTCDVYFIIAFI